ncbi:hypothetical protein ATCC90586_000662 [Pythium insidiosum]|nr:hypothetical protein ATCC90586_000662 [Pythium insidiosum]
MRWLSSPDSDSVATSDMLNGATSASATELPLLLVNASDRQATHRTPSSAFAVLGDSDGDSVQSVVKASDKRRAPYTPVRGVIPSSPVCDREPDDRGVGVGYALSIGMWTCLVVHVVGLLLFFTSWYNDVAQVALFRLFFWSMRAFQDDVDARRNAVAFIYLMLVGLVPSVTADLQENEAQCFVDFKHTLEHFDEHETLHVVIIIECDLQLA